MSTRGTFGLQVDNKIKAFYNHYDSYYSCLGQGIIDTVKTLQQNNMFDQFKYNFMTLNWVDNEIEPSEELKQYYSVLEYLGNSNFNHFGNKEWYSLLRNAQSATSLALIASGYLKHLIDNSEFIDDDVFCEYSYIFNFDSNHLDIYRMGRNLVHSIAFDDIKNIDKLTDYLCEN